MDSSNAHPSGYVSPVNGTKKSKVIINQSAPAIGSHTLIADAYKSMVAKTYRQHTIVAPLQTWDATILFPDLHANKN